VPTATHAGLTRGLPPPVRAVLRSGGRAIEPATRRLMDLRFGEDFSGVRVHADNRADAAASALGARAFTAGANVVFARGAYAPATASGRELLAHELAHVLQQRRAPASVPTRVAAPDDAHERDARSLAHAVIAGTGAGRSVRPAPHAIQRQPKPPPKKPGADLATELQAVIDGATWKEIRKRVYPKESAAGVQRAKERKAGTRAELTGLGRITTLERFATAVKGIVAKWMTLKWSERVKALWAAADVELAAAEVPGFLNADREPMEFKGYFDKREWKFVLSKSLIEGRTPSTDEAADLANTTLHESRHAEQEFLAARFSAGVNGRDAAAIKAEQDIPKTIADQAVNKKFDKATDATTAALGKEMYKASVTEGAKNQAISNDDGLADLKAKRDAARTALAKLKAGANAKTIADATAARDDLRKQIAVVEQLYTLYRAIPYEADAHEVGDAETQAYLGWP
jgi:Domain of unknown function (DUF4157)